MLAYSEIECDKEVEKCDNDTDEKVEERGETKEKKLMAEKPLILFFTLNHISDN